MRGKSMTYRGQLLLRSGLRPVSISRVPSGKLKTCCASEGEATTASLSASVFFLFPSAVTDHVRQHPIRAGHPRAQLTIPNHAGVDVSAASVISHEQAAL